MRGAALPAPPSPRRSLRRLLAAAVCLGLGCRGGERTPAAPARDIALRDSLVARLAIDQAVRDTLVAGLARTGAVDPALAGRQNAIDAGNTAWLKALVARRGWPTRAEVDSAGVAAAFLLVQHADRDPAFQAAMLPHLLAAHRAGEVSGQEVALLTDRVAVARGARQPYGTQTTLRDGRLVVHPIEDSARVDARRAAMGLPPLAEYLRVLDSVYLGRTPPRPPEAVPPAPVPRARP